MSDTDLEPVVETPSSDLAGPSEYSSERPFTEFPLAEEVLQGIAARGYTHPTPVQARVLDSALEGNDLIVRSKTGTGKTAAFAIPLIQRLQPGTGKVQAIVLCPTRELALQVATEVEALAGPKGLRVLAVYGGTSMQKQFDALDAPPEFVVGTPGRILDHLRRRTLDLSGVTARVLDEADEMLSMGFYEEVCRILDETPKDAQTLLFSATVSADIENLIRGYAKEPETILLTGDEFSVEGIANILYETREEYPKPRNLLYLLDMEDPPSALIFCNTRDDTAMVTAVLNHHGLDADFINSDLTQAERERAMGRIKRGELRFLVATDLAARGIDISDLSHVINYSLPEDPAVYMHRVGRTGRIGKSGTAISLITGRDIHTLQALEAKYGIELERRRLPDAEEARKQWADRHVRELAEAMQDEVFEAFIPLAHEVMKRGNAEYLLAFALKYFFSRRRRDKAQAAKVEERRERPAREASDDRSRRPRDRDRPERGARADRPERGPRGDRPERGPRGDRPERGPREDRPEGRRRPEREPQAAGEAIAQEPGSAPAAEAPAEAEGPKNRVYAGLGRTHGLDSEQIKAAVIGAANADPLTVVSVDVKDSHSYLDAQDEDAARVLLEAAGKAFSLPSGEEIALRVEFARPRSAHPPRRRARR